ncbi:hypothetical protein QA584_22825 [Anaerocolumna sp. AGMB13025]|uniref:hypothetical protein n=1 Tax=Anaerocolumna sp. AGMB13025 TaxID=3039116 RepID=UPI00241D3404|nr:hypothetical protein [Anaerocolumna sp. AGMB13025]WFR56419.1 hypothetical protein QA584_22825 [Anaerocolumna sp. AGMB13025]
MANKIQIKKFLEKKQQDAKIKLNEMESQEVNEAVISFISTHESDIKKIKILLGSLDRVFDGFISMVNKYETAVYKSEYSNAPGNRIDGLIRFFNGSNIKEYFAITEVKKIEVKYKKLREESYATYDNLIALCQANNAADSVKILENLGFDISEIEVKKEECTALVTNIDVSKLFIVKEDK